MVKLEPQVEANFRIGRTDAMFYDPQRVIFGTDGKDVPYEVWVSGHKKFMLCGKTYEDEEATRRILDWTTTTACLNAFLNMKTILVLEKNTLVLRKAWNITCTPLISRTCTVGSSRNQGISQGKPYISGVRRLSSHIAMLQSGCT